MASPPVRRRWKAATIRGVSATSLYALRRFASELSSSTVGSRAAAAETTVRSTVIGLVPSPREEISRTSAGSSRCSDRRKAFSSSSCARVGRARWWSRYTVSSKVECSARSAMSYLLMIAARSLAAPSGAPPRGGVHRLPPAVRLPRTGHVVGPCRHAAREVLRRSFQMAHRVTFIPGDGVGPELSEATRRVLEGTGVDFDWDVQEAGADVIEKYGTPLPEPVLESIRANGVAIKGPLTTPIGTGFRSVNVALRKELDLFACLRPCKWYQGV